MGNCLFFHCPYVSSLLFSYSSLSAPVISIFFFFFACIEGFIHQLFLFPQLFSLLSFGEKNMFLFCSFNPFPHNLLPALVTSVFLFASRVLLSCFPEQQDIFTLSSSYVIALPSHLQSYLSLYRHHLFHALVLFLFFPFCLEGFVFHPLSSSIFPF